MRIANARLADGNLCDIDVAAGRIAALAAASGAPAAGDDIDLEFEIEFVKK